MTGSARDPSIRAQFTARAPVYDDVSAWVTDPGMLAAIVGACQAPRTASLLDVCCGTGAVGGAFRGRVARVTGIDLTLEMLRRASVRLDAAAQASAIALPFADATFDAVVIRQALHFVFGPERAVREMFRVLRPGGQLVLCHRIPYGPDAAWWERVNRAKQELACNFFIENDLRRLIAEAGFERLALTDYFLWESIQAWMDSPEARAATERVFDLYRSAPDQVVRLRGITIGATEIRDRWRWAIFSAFKPA
ncbi:MAG: class I SAM-dependent methyltransferase [Candidatus Wallbacteria bacterium]|nr:class I SAM-dependent methyltransferase [Candidatus Wallbacteria bacterium]